MQEFLSSLLAGFLMLVTASEPLPSAPETTDPSQEIVYVSSPTIQDIPEPEEIEADFQTALVSYYGKPSNLVRDGETDFNGRRTASGTVYRHTNDTIVAHNDLPFGTVVEMRYNGNVHRVTVQDRGPCHGNRTFDLSWAAAGELGFRDRGVAEVEWRVIELGDRDPPFRCPTRGLLYG